MGGDPIGDNDRYTAERKGFRAGSYLGWAQCQLGGAWCQLGGAESQLEGARSQFRARWGIKVGVQKLLMLFGPYLGKIRLGRPTEHHISALHEKKSSF